MEVGFDVGPPNDAGLSHVAKLLKIALLPYMAYYFCMLHGPRRVMHSTCTVPVNVDVRMSETLWLSSQCFKNYYMLE